MTPFFDVTRPFRPLRRLWQQTLHRFSAAGASPRISDTEQPSDGSETERRLSFMLESVPVNLWSTDSKLNITFSQGAGLHLIGLDGNDQVGMTLYEVLKTRDPGFTPLAAHLRALRGELVRYEVDWRGRSFETRVESNVPDGVSAVLAGTKAVTTAQMTVPAASLDCKNGTMNEHMRKALKADKNPTITFRITTYDVAKASEGVDGTAQGELTLGGVTKTITVKAHAASQPDGVLRLTGSQDIHMTEFGLKPPTLMLGTLKVDELVKVSFDLLLKGGPAAAAD